MRNVSKRSLSLHIVTMQNKLKRSKNVKFSWSQSKAQTNEVVVSSKSSCSNGETSPPAEDKHFSNAAAGFSGRQVRLLQGERKALCAKDAKVAPIFLRAKQQRKRKRSSDGDPPGEKTQKSVQPSQSDDVQASHLTGKDDSVLSTWRGQLSPSALYSCLEEIQTSNPAFPVQTLFRTLQKKASEGLQECGSTAGHSSYPSPFQRCLKEKRRRENEISKWVPNHLRSNLTAEDAAGVSRCHLSAQEVQDSRVVAVKKQPRSSRLSHTHRQKHQTESIAANLVNGWTNHTESDIQSPKDCETLQRDSCFEDVLWTDKYSPQDSGEVIGNAASVNRLHSWLKKWKLRADCDERRRKMEERKQAENSNDSWDCGDFQGEAGSEDGGEEPLCNTMLITGPSGVGKTASVYACAQELGFKVFEVNCSSQRSGRHVLSQLQEATQSHLVETSGTDPLKPAYFNNYSTNKSETLPGKPALHKNVISTRKKRAAQNLASSTRKVKAKPATVTLAHYFTTKAKADHFHFGGLSPSEKPDSKKLGESSSGCDQTMPRNKTTATSLILFEEVDVIFDDDVGFLVAIKAFMTTTKRPVILTTNDRTFKGRFDCSLEEIIFKTPSTVNVCSYLQLVCLAENERLDLDDISSLLRLSCGDIRHCLLQLQLWVSSGGRRASQSGRLLKCVQYSNATEGGNSLDSQVPPCKTGCSASMLGLHPVTPNYLLNLLKGQSWSETDMNKLLNVLAESWRRAVPLLYSNLELLLSIGAKRTLEKLSLSGLQSQPAPSYSNIYFQKQNQNVSPKVSVTSRKPVRNISRLSRRKYISSSSNSTNDKPHVTSSSLNRAPSSSQSSDDKTEQKVTSDCLGALTDFFDLMSYLDATLPAAGTLVSGSCTPEAFVWTGAELKDGLLDEMNEEEGWTWSQERLLDIQAAVEGLGCRKCWWRVSEAWSGAQKYRQKLEDKRWGRLVESLALTASSKRQSFSFSFQPVCARSVSQRRNRLSRMVLSSKSFSLLGNRQAVSVDYMPALRSICRSQHKTTATRGDSKVSELPQQYTPGPLQVHHATPGRRFHLAKRSGKT